MTKIGVGVGEEFPIEDKPEGDSASGASSGPGYDRRYDHGGCGWDHEEWRAHRREWREQRREWRRQFREEMRARCREGEYGGLFYGLPRFLRIILKVAIVILVLRLVAAAPLLLLGVVVAGVLYAAHRRHEYEAYPQDITPPSEGR